MLVTLSGIVIDVKRLQPENAEPPMLVTLSGIVIDVKPLHSLKAEPPMLVTLSGIIVFMHPYNKVFEAVLIIALQFSRESYYVLPFATTMDVRQSQPKKTSLPIDVTLFGISMDAKLVHS